MSPPSKYAFPRILKELRFHLSQTGEASVPLRKFLNRAYPVMKKHNPATPVLVREAFGVRPTVFARFEFGKETKLHLDGITDSEIEARLTDLIFKQHAAPAPKN
ncbi:NI8M subunit of mitochondrial NADH:ubiquinone oxidoreductase (complex I), putative [Geotrichum candidum]|uniref:NI8M subunit of mitochondrial NADH:ubiquinone oxidoreductase (Complex I), putative n=1 Tax=Geotrichum candidum TaxID=1173061 RepID=A0A0J9XIK9_GEOCN|nr:NI8M subunit of mitochondrial NADH:ubiquinone oxidoreductase (complex I), putative [Geotrichum candidum]